MKILTVVGTRPEAIKMAPLVRLLAGDPRFESRLCVTAQHRQMLDQVLEIFALEPDHDLQVMTSGQSLYLVASRVMERMEPILETERPDLVLVHGDTSTTFLATLASFYAGVPVGHVEAGLRTGDLRAPWPEEANRRLTATLAALHFAPTERASRNLRRENVPEERIHVTGNTVVDALLSVHRKIGEDADLRRELDAGVGLPLEDSRIVLVTGHRREHFGAGFERILEALVRIVTRYEDVQIVFPVHYNPRVREAVHGRLAGRPRIHLIEPLDYLNFVRLMQRCHLIVTDSGGIQEEAPSLGKPVLVTREATERPEAIEAGVARLVGTSTERIVGEASRLLDDGEAYAEMSRAGNPYGDGRASERIVEAVARFLGP